MKKRYIAFVLLTGILVTPLTVGAELNFASLWKRWVEMHQLFFRIQEPVTPAFTIPEQKTEIPTVSTTPSIPERPTYRPRVVSSTLNTASTVNATIKAIQPRESVHTITTDPVNVFQIGVRNATQKSSLTFSEALLLDKATFVLFSNTGITEDVRDLELDIEGASADFNADGTVTVRFQNARLAQGESLYFNVSVRIKDPNTTPHVPGTLRLRLKEMTAVGESSQKLIDVRLLGTTTSSQIVFDPVSTVTGTNTSFSGNSYTSISGGTIAAGEKKYVLSTNFSAYYDDFSIREITLRNTLTGGNIDSFINSVQVIDMRTGESVATGRFVNGAAKLVLSPRVFVGRSQNVRLGFQVMVADTIQNSGIDSRFELGIAPEDILVESRTTGRPLADANKQFSVDSAVFSISQGRMAIAPAGQQYPFATDIGSPDTIFRFLVNSGPSEVSLGRVSFAVYPDGCTFDGGVLDASDVKLVRINGSRQENQSVNVTAAGNTITLDFPTEFYLYKNSSVEFGLQVALDNLPGNSDSDLVSIRILGDSTHQTGTLAAVRAAGSNFIWSDLSARMHNTTTTDWYSGHLVSGLPGQNVIVMRFGN